MGAVPTTMQKASSLLWSGLSRQTPRRPIWIPSSSPCLGRTKDKQSPMNSRIFSRRSQITANSTGGFSLIELLVTLFIAGIMLSSTASFFSMNVATRQNMGMVTEAQQGLRALLGIVTQELRQASACLPSTGLFIALNGINNGTQDSLTVRIGQVDRVTLACVQGALSAAAAKGATTVSVTAGQGSLFADTTLMYITDGANGEFH